ncbi:sugar ABC transporter permease [Clostridia bacterium]|nr:sugar ABC transporter permease [Clostridia bacterium]
MEGTFKRQGGEKIIGCLNTVLLLFIMLCALYPLVFVVSSSFSEPAEVLKGNVLLFPKGINVDSYRRVFAHDSIMRGYLNSLIYTVAGTLVNMIMTVLCAYPLSRKDLVGKTTITSLIVFTMYFSGGLIPTYLVVSRWLNLKNTIFALVLPGAISVYNMIIMRSYFVSSIPDELNDAALIDGCSHIRLLTRVMLPLSMPVLAVVGMYYLVGHWNAWFDALIYMSDRKRYPLQLVLKSVLVDGTESLVSETDLETAVNQLMLSESIKYAVIVVASVPVLLIYPFLQRFFVKGVMVGALKG